MVKKRVIPVLMVLLIIISFTLAQESPFALEQRGAIEEELAEEIEIIEDRAGTTPDSPLYVIDEIVEDVTLAVKDGENKAEYALQVKQEKVAEATIMANEQKQGETAEALQKAQSVSAVAEQEISPRLRAIAKDNVEFSKRMLAAIQKNTPEGWEEVGILLDEQLTAEEKVRLAVEIASGIGEYCEELSYVDYNAVLQDTYCNPDTAPTWLQEAVEGEITQREEAAIDKYITEMTICINDPRSCRCSEIPVEKHQQNCEENKALAISCLFEQDRAACEELDQRPLVPEGTPDFLRPAFEETMAQLIEERKQELFSQFAPSECIEAGISTPEECQDLMRELYGEPPEECQQDGQFIGQEECQAIMIEKFNIPSECISGGRLASREECEAIMIQQGTIPAECVQDGQFIGQEECEEIMSAQFEIPSACQEDGKFIGREACEQIILEQVQIEVGGGLPPECMEEGQFIGMEECTAIIQEKVGAGGFPGGFPGGPPGGIPPGIEGGLAGIELPPEIFDASVLDSLVPGGDLHLVLGEGGSELVSIDELQQVKELAEQALEEVGEHSAEAEQLREALAQLEETQERVDAGIPIKDIIQREEGIEGEEIAVEEAEEVQEIKEVGEEEVAGEEEVEEVGEGEVSEEAAGGGEESAGE